MKLPGARRQVQISLVLLASTFVLGIAPGFAQSLADIARQERERQKNLPPKHVYTNEDFERQEILLPKDRKVFEADHKLPASLTSPAPGIQAVAPRDINQIPLGDVARHYKMLERLGEIQQADEVDVLPAATPVLASPTIAKPAAITIPKLAWKQENHLRLAQPRENVTLDNANRILVSKGDSLWMLAARYLGNGTRWHEILKANPQLRNPNVIRIGEWLALPLHLETSAPTSAKNNIRVQKGDTLWKLARVNFGDGLAWGCIAQANPLLPDPSRIYSGQMITLPSRCNSLSLR